MRTSFLRTLALLSAVVCARSGTGAEFVRGDADASLRVDITDPIVVLNYLFLGQEAPRCLDAGDGNDDGALDIADAVYILNFLFVGGAPPPPPFPERGEDPTPDALGCEGCPPGVPCVLVESTILYDASASSLVAPAMRLGSNGELHIAFPSDHVGYYGRYTQDGWVIEAMEAVEDGSAVPATWMDLALLPPNDTPAILTYHGPSELWLRTPEGTWERGPAHPTAQVGGRERYLGLDPQGHLIAALDLAGGSNPSQAGIGTLGETWSLLPIGDPIWVEAMVLGFFPDGKPYAAYWEASGTDGWLLRTGTPETSPVTVAPLGSGSLDNNSSIFTATESVEGTPRRHFLASRLQGDSFSPDSYSGLDLLLETEPDRWEPIAIAADDPWIQNGDYCFEAPPFDGAVCTVDFTAHYGAGLIRQEDGPLLCLYTRLRTHGRLVAECPDESPLSCSLRDETEQEGSLLLSWIDNGVPREITLVDDVVATRAASLVDAQGQLHVLLYDRWKQLRYLRFR